MATRGFEFAYMLDGSNATPVIRDFILSTAAAHYVGDLLVMETDGDLTQAAGTATTVTAVCMEAVAAASISAGVTKAKCAIITRNQVWRCSSDADHTTWVIGYTKAGDIIDCRTLDHDNVDNGPCCCVDNAASLDDGGKQVNYVNFLLTTFGNA
jgi:hypothetical protein